MQLVPNKRGPRKRSFFGWQAFWRCYMPLGGAPRKDDFRVMLSQSIRQLVWIRVVVELQALEVAVTDHPGQLHDIELLG